MDAGRRLCAVGTPMFVCVLNIALDRCDGMIIPVQRVRLRTEKAVCFPRHAAIFGVDIFRLIRDAAAPSGADAATQNWTD